MSNVNKLINAVNNEDIESMSEILNVNDFDINDKNEDGWNALMFAVDTDNLEIVRFLVSEGGANIYHKDNDQWQPIHLASWKASIKIVRYLVQQGSNLKAVTSEGRTPLDLATNYNDKNVIKYLNGLTP